MNGLWLIFVMLFSANLAAREVIVTGYGTSVDLALQNAKTVAIEQVAGTFVTGETTVEDDAYRSRIEQYHGGLIRRYEVLGIEQQDGLISTRIAADVDTDKVNTVLTDQGADVSSDAADELTAAADEFERIGRIVAGLDDPQQAFTVQITKVTYRNRGPLTDVEIDVQITTNPKWYDDMRTMARTIGRKVDLGSAWSDALWGLAALSAIVNPMLPGTINHLARASEKKPQPSDEYAACFGRDMSRDVDECYEIRHPLERLTLRDRWPMELHLLDGEEEKVLARYFVNIRNRLFVEVRQGTNLYFTSSAKERRFENPGVLLFEQSMMPFKYATTLPTTALTEGAVFRMSLTKPL